MVASGRGVMLSGLTIRRGACCGSRRHHGRHGVITILAIFVPRIVSPIALNSRVSNTFSWTRDWQNLTVTLARSDADSEPAPWLVVGSFPLGKRIVVRNGGKICGVKWREVLW